MTCKKISVQLDNMADTALKEIMEINKCSISDAVNAALLSYSKDKQPSMIIDRSPWALFKEQFAEVSKDTIANWCEHRSIDITRLRYLITRTANGGNVCGFGNKKNKWRDKNDDRQFKTHTSWIAHCLKQDFDLDIT